MSKVTVVFVTAFALLLLTLFPAFLVSASSIKADSLTSFTAKEEGDRIASAEDFSLTPSTFLQMVPRDESTSTYLLPSNPSLSMLAKLILAIDSSGKKLGLITYMVRQYTHYDPDSIKMFQNTIESLVSLADLHKSIKMIDSDSYAQVLISITQLTTVLMNFLRTFTSSLLAVRLSEVSVFKLILLNVKHLQGMFYMLENCIKEPQSEYLIDAIFSAVESVEDETLVWTFYRKTISPSVCVPLPFKYLTMDSRGQEIINNLPITLISAFEGDPQGRFNYSWLTQLGLIIRFRVLKSSEILQIAKFISPHLDKPDYSHIGNFMRLAFLDELARRVPLKDALNYLPVKPALPSDAEFYIELWNLIITKKIPNNGEKYFIEYCSHVIQSLESEFPGIIEKLSPEDYAESEALRSQSFILRISHEADLSTPKGIQESIEFIRTVIKHEISEMSFSSILLHVKYIYDELLSFVEAIEKSETDDPSLLKELITEVSIQLLTLRSGLKYLPSVTGTPEIDLLIEFAFKMDNINEAEMITDLILNRIEKDDNLLRSFFTKFAECLSYRNDFFCLRVDQQVFARLKVQIVAEFLQKTKTVALTDGLVIFYTSAYLNNAMDHEFVLDFLERLKSCDLASVSAEDTWNLLVGALTEVSYYEFKDKEDSSEFLHQKLADSQIYAVKLLHILSSIDGIENRIDIQISILPWLCAKISTFESLKFDIVQRDQLKPLRATKNGDTNISLCVQSLRTLLINGASSKDLQNAFKFVVQFREYFNQSIAMMQKRNLAISASFCLLVLIIRTDNSLISTEYAEQVMTHYKLTDYKVSAPQIIYKSIQDPQKRSALFPVLSKLTLNYNDYGFLLDAEMFDGMPLVTKAVHRKNFFKSAFTSEWVDRLRLEMICHWTTQGLVPLALVQETVERIGGKREQAIILKLTVSLLRAIYKHPEYRSLRIQAARLLFIDIDHTYVFPPPYSMGIVGGISDLLNEPEFIDALHQEVTKNSFDIHAMIRTEQARLARITKQNALDLSDGIENLMQTYVEALTQLASFDMILNRKIVILNSVFRALQRLTTQEGQSDVLATEYSDNLLDDFVRMSIHLVCQIHTDITAPTFHTFLDEHTIRIMFSALILFVRDSNVQSLLVFHIFGAIKERKESREEILQILPQFSNWRRSLLLPDTFKYIFNFNGPVELFDAFMSDYIESAFRFDDFGLSDAIDFSRDYKQMSKIHDSYFTIMTHLIKNYNLPAKYTLKFLKLMNIHDKRIEIISTHLVSFLKAAIKVRKIDPLSKVFRITSTSYGRDCVYDSQKEVALSVIEFLAKRPDFLGLSLLNNDDTDAFMFMVEMESIAKNFPSFNLPPVLLIRTLFKFSINSVENLKLLDRVELPKHTHRSLAMWLVLSYSSAKNLNENAIPVALIALSLFPETFTLQSFTDLSISQSWSETSASLLTWIKKLCIDFPKKFGRAIEETGLKKLLNILLWSLEYDGKEEKVSSAHLALLNTITYADEQLKYNLVHLLSVPYYQPLMKELIKLDSFYDSMGSILRKWTTLNPSLAKEVEKLIWAFLDEPITAEEEEIMNTRIRFSEDLRQLKEASNNLVYGSYSFYCARVAQLRSMREIDLVLKFIAELGNLVKVVYPRERSQETADLAYFIAVTIVFLRRELLLQANSAIFVDFFEFLFKHFSSRKNPEYFNAITLILAQIRPINHIQNVFAAIITDLRLEACLLPSSGFPDQFYEVEGLYSFYLDSYFNRLNYLGTSQSREGHVGIDRIHFIHLFNSLHNSNASDVLFRKWIDNVKRIHHNDLVTETFAKNLKLHCLTRKHLIHDFIPIYINRPLIEKIFTSMTQSCKENLLSVYKLMMINNSPLYQQEVEKLPKHLKELMKEHVGASFNDKKRKLVQDFVSKCDLPGDSNFDPLTDLQPDLFTKLETVLKLDLSLLYSEHFLIFFRRLNVLIDGLSEQDKLFGIIAVASAIQLKNQKEPNSEAIMKVFRQPGTFNFNEETVNLLLKFVSTLDFEFSEVEATSIALMSLKSSNCNQILIELFRNPKLKCHTLQMIKSILKSNTNNDQLEIDLIVQIIIYERLNTVDNSLQELFNLARINKLLPKTVLLILEGILN